MPPSPSPSYHCLDPSQLCHHKICKLALLLISLFLFLISPVYLTRMLMLHFFSTTDALVIVKRNATLISRPCILFWLHKAKIQETLNVAAPPSRMIFFWQIQCWQLVEVGSVDIPGFIKISNLWTDCLPKWQGGESWVSPKLVGGWYYFCCPSLPPLQLQPMKCIKRWWCWWWW